MYIPSALRRHWDALIDPPLLFSRKQGLDTILILTRTIRRKSLFSDPTSLVFSNTQQRDRKVDFLTQLSPVGTYSLVAKLNLNHLTLQMRIHNVFLTKTHPRGVQIKIPYHATCQTLGNSKYQPFFCKTWLNFQ